MERILITGASGFVGGHVLQAFRGAFTSAEILGIGRRASLNVPEGVTYESLDLRDPTAVAHRIESFRPTEVLHLAGEASVARATRSKFDTWRANLGALYNLLDTIERIGEPCTFAFVSSGEVYGRAFNEHCPATEQMTPQPMNAYARSKAIGEELLIRSTEGTCLKPIVLRPFNHIGPGQDLAFAIPSFCQQIALIEAGRQSRIVEVGNLSPERDFLDVSDVVGAYIEIFRHVKSFEGPQIFNICSGQPRTVESMLMVLRELSVVEFECRPTSNRIRKSEVPSAYGDASRLRQATGWTPKIDVVASLAQILDDARAKIAGALL